MVKVPIFGILIKGVLLNKVFFPDSNALEMELQAAAQQYGPQNVSRQPLFLIDDRNVYNPLSQGKHTTYSSDLGFAKPQFAGSA